MLGTEAHYLGSSLFHFDVLEDGCSQVPPLNAACLPACLPRPFRSVFQNRYGEDVSVLEMDGQFDKLEELIYVESHLSNTSAKFYGEITQQMLKNSSFPGSNNGTGLLQTIIGLKVCVCVREGGGGAAARDGRVWQHNAKLNQETVDSYAEG